MTEGAGWWRSWNRRSRLAAAVAAGVVSAIALGIWATPFRGVTNATTSPFVSMRDSRLTNGSFEDGLSGWLADGHITIAASDPVRPAADGAAVLVFNSGDEPSAGASLSQTFATTAGRRYALAFDFGTVGAIADQVMRVTVVGDGVLFDRMLSASGLNGDTFYVPYRFGFVADSSNTTLTLTDQSYTYVVIDGLLDNVRVFEESTELPAVVRHPERVGVPEGQMASFTVEATGPGPLRYQWRFGNRDIPGATGPELRIAADQSNAGNYSVVVTNRAGSITSSAATLTVLPPEILVNGSFEYGSAGWSFSGPDAWNASISTNARYGVTDGSQLAHFNWGQHEPGGGISQTISTVPGRQYVLSFDVGAFSLLNRDEQRMRVIVRGATEILSREIVVFAPGTGGRYRRQELKFTATSPATTVVFEDRSRSTINIDLLLDNVRVTQVDSRPPVETATRAGSAGPSGL